MDEHLSIAPSDVLVKPRFFSNSELATFKACPRKWYVSYYLEQTAKNRGQRLISPLPLGIRVHAALEIYYNSNFGRNYDPTPAIMDWFDKQLESEVEQLIDVRAQAEFPNQVESFEKGIVEQDRLSRVMVMGYLDWLAETGADAHYELVGTELVVQTDGPGRSVFRGKLDWMVRDERTGHLIILDHKTAKSLDDKLGSLHPQMRLYAHCWNAMHADDPTMHIRGAVYNRLKKNLQTAAAKPPFYQRETIHFNMPELARVYAQAIELMEHILTLEGRLAKGADPTVALYPAPSMACSWSCEHLKTRLCSAMNDPMSDYLWVLGEHYEKFDKDARYVVDVSNPMESEASGLYGL